MFIIGIILFFWGIAEIAKQTRINKQAAQIAKINAEQAEQRRKAEDMRREQMALARAQMEFAKEQARQAEEIEKHTAQIEKLQFQMGKAEADIAHWNETVNSLYALLDIEQAEQAGAVPGSKSDIKHQKAIITLRTKIHTAEQKLAKARFDKDQAEQKLVA